MDKIQAKDLFHLYTDLVDGKVDMAVSKAIDRVLERIDSLDKGMNQRFVHFEKDMNQRFTHLEQRVVRIDTDMSQRFAHLETGLEKRFTNIETRVAATENNLLSLNKVLDQIRTNFINYFFNALWVILGGVGSYLLLQIVHLFIK